MSENKDRSKEDEDEDPDFYIRTIASTWGHLDLIGDWLPHHRHEPDKITHNVLFPAAMYGQLNVLKLAWKDGEFTFVMEAVATQYFVEAGLHSSSLHNLKLASCIAQQLLKLTPPSLSLPFSILCYFPP